MFTPKANLSSSFTHRTQKSGSKRKSSLLTPGMRRGQLGRSGLAHTILEETESHTVESYGSSLPVVVTEILTLSEKTSDVSVSLSPNGWAWLVHGRRLVIWRYKLLPTQRVTTATCRELTLPPSDLAHDAKLVNIFINNENQTPSCIAVSPEGIVRYWPSIAHEGASVEVSADLQGQECFSLTDLQPVGSVLSTTTSTIVLVHPHKFGGQHSIACRILKSSKGLLGGIGRRMSSLLWGGMTANAEAKLVQVIGNTSFHDSEEKNVYVLTATSLQKWQIDDSESDKLFYDSDIDSIAREAFSNKLWGQEGSNPAWLRIWLLDMQPTEDGVAILMGALNQNVSSQLHFAIGHVRTQTQAPPMCFTKFGLLQHTRNFDETKPHISLRFLLLPSGEVMLYEKNSVMAVPAGPYSDPGDMIDFSAPGNGILGAGVTDGQPLFFTVSCGMVTILTNNHEGNSVMEHSTLNESGLDRLGASTRLSESLNLSVSQAGLENLTMSESRTDQLKAAFLFYCKKSMGQATSIVEDLFPPTHAMTETDSPLDRLVVGLSRDLIDDYPASDPRWMKSVPASEIGLGSTMSMLVQHQIEDKMHALEFYKNFLKDVGVWERLSGVSKREMTMATTHLLCEHAEKTTAMLTLRIMHNNTPMVVDEAFKLVLKKRKIEVSGALTPQDHFYREISKVGDVFEAFQTIQDRSVATDCPEDIVQKIMTINRLLLGMLREALQFRARKSAEFAPLGEAGRFEFLPWTSSPGPNGIRTHLITQFNATINQCVPLIDDVSTKNEAFKQLVEMADIILDGYKAQLETVRGERKKSVFRQYEKDRAAVIMPFVTKGYFDDAASLAEKYYEFGVLVKLCEVTNDRGRLEKYMDQFAGQGFSDFVFDWHVREGKQGRLLAQTSSRRQGELGRFLSGHNSISWLHDIQTQKYMEASHTLNELAHAEAELVSRKKTMLSLAKLTALASDAPSTSVEAQVSDVDNQSVVVAAQEQLPKAVIESFGFDPDQMRVLSARDLIELYIGDENTDSDHIDFKKALDLLEYVKQDDGDDDHQKLRLHIWARSVLRNSWKDLDTDDPIGSIKDTVFFRLVEFCYLQGLDLTEHLPSAEHLMEAEELQSLQQDANFKFLIQTGYEHVQRICT